MPTIPVWVPPLPSADTLNQQRSSPINVIAEGQPLPIIYGKQQVRGKIFALDYDSGTETWTVGVAWSIGENQSIDQVYMNGAAPAGGVSQNDYVGTTSQTADALLSGAIAGYSDTLVITLPAGDIGVSYSAFQYSNSDYPTFPQFRAEISGRKILQGAPSGSVAFSETPAFAIYDFIVNDYYGMGESADYASFYAVAQDNDATVTTEARRKIGLAMETPLPAVEWLKILAAYASCWVYKIGDTWYATSDRPRSQDAALTTDDWVENSFALQVADKNRIPTVVELVYTDTNETIWRDRIVPKALSGVSSGTVPRRVSRVRMPGVTRYSQAAREAQERLNKLQQYLTISYDGFDDELVRLPGDVIDVSRGTHLTNVDFRVVAPPRRSSNGAISVQAIKYSASDYVDTEESDPTYGANSGFLGDGVAAGSVSVGNTLAMIINVNTGGSASSGEGIFIGINPATGGADTTKNGFILFDGTLYTIPRNEYGSVTFLTGLANKSGFLVYETAEDDPFTVSAVAGNCAFVFQDEVGDWYYDNNSTAVAFTPTATMVALAWLETSTADLIAGGGLLGEPVPLTMAAHPGATDGATAGTNLKNEAGAILDDVDVRNDQIVVATLAALNFNPSFQFFRERLSGPSTGLGTRVPAGWFLSGTSTNGMTYLDPAAPDIMVMPNATGAQVCGAAIRVNPDTSYEFVALVRSQSGTSDIYLVANEYDTDLLPSGKVAIGTASSAEDEVETRDGNVAVASGIGVGTSFQLVSGEYVPTSSAKWFSPMIYADNDAGGDQEIEWYVVRDKSTVGATTGTNLLDAAGNVIDDSVITNFDDASALGFNPAFATWTTSSSPPDGWSQWTTATGRSRVTSPKLAGPYALQFAVASGNVGIRNDADITFSGDSVVIGSVDIYISTYTSGGSPGLLIDLAEQDSGGYYRQVVNSDTSITGAWQRVYFKASRTASAAISSPGGTGPFDNINIYVMGSYSGMSGGSFVGTVVFDNLRFAILSPDIDNEAQVWANISGTTNAPADNATVGATWDSNITGQPTLGDLATQDEVTQLDIANYAAVRTSVAVTTSEVDVSASSWNTVETVSVEAPANVTNSAILVEISFQYYELDATNGTDQGGFTRSCRLLDDDSNPVLAADGIFGTYVRSSNAASSAWRAYTSFTKTYLIEPADINANESNLFTFQIFGNASIDTMKADDIVMRATLLNRSQ